MKLARRLYQARKDLVRDKNLKSIVVGGRIPGYYTCKDEMSVHEYVENVEDKTLYDPVLTTQLLSFSDTRRPGDAARKLAEYTPQYLEMFSEFAIRYNINIIGGSQFEVAQNSLYNVGYFFGRDGTIGRQRKIHVTPNEWRWWGVTGGDKVEVFDTDCGRIAILICYDIEFPELARIAAQKGARMLSGCRHRTPATASIPRDHAKLERPPEGSLRNPLRRRRQIQIRLSAVQSDISCCFGE